MLLIQITITITITISITITNKYVNGFQFKMAPFLMNPW